MNYETVFDDITRIIRKDYAGAKEIKNPSESADFAQNLATAFKMKKLDDVYFLRVMRQYLATLRDKNLRLTLADNDHFKNGTRGITVRCYEKELYVTSSEDERIHVGDKLGKINAKSPKWYLEHLTKNILWSDVQERMDWSEFLNSSERVRVDRPDGTTEFMDLKNFPLPEAAKEVVAEMPDAHTMYLRIDHFLDEDMVQKAIDENAAVLDICDRIIVDLRKNIGGYENAFYPLLPYVVDSTMMLSEFMGEQGIYTNFTKRNCNRRINQMKPFLESEDEDIRRIAQELTEEAKARAGAGFIYEKDEDLIAHDQKIEARGHARMIFLVDSTTEDAAETLIQQSKRMKRVTVVGRPTRGTIDYSNIMTIAYEGGFRFSYPISRSRDCEKGRGVMDKGIAVDEYVAWTPEEIGKDLILEKALEIG